MITQTKEIKKEDDMMPLSMIAEGQPSVIKKIGGKEETRRFLENLGDWAEEMGIEAVYIDKDTKIRDFKNELRWNEAAYRK